MELASLIAQSSCGVKTVFTSATVGDVGDKTGVSMLSQSASAVDARLASSVLIEPAGNVVLAMTKATESATNQQAPAHPHRISREQNTERVTTSNLPALKFPLQQFP